MDVTFMVVNNQFSDLEVNLNPSKGHSPSTNSSRPILNLLLSTPEINLPFISSDIKMATETRDFALEAGKQSTPKKAKVTFANTAPPASNEPRRIVYRLAWEHYRYPGAVPTAGYGTTLYASRRDANNKIVEKYNASDDPKIKSMRHGMDLAGNFWSAIHFVSAMLLQFLVMMGDFC